MGEQQIVVKDKDVQVGVFLIPADGYAKNGEPVADLVLAVDELRKLQKLAELSKPKFEAALQEKENIEQVRAALLWFGRRVGKVGVLAVKKN